MKSLALATITATLLASGAIAAEKYVLDPSHSQVLFSYNHLGFSTTTGMFSGFEGEIMLDEANPANSSVSVSMKADAIITGWAERDQHFSSPDFIGASENPTITFQSTGIEVTGEKTANITGDLTINGITKPVTLATTLNQMGEHPMAKKAWMGFNAETTILRSEFDMGQFAPFVSDEVALEISVEAMKAE